MAGPFKMKAGKGGPMLKNFGISPVKDVNKSRKIAEENKPDTSLKQSNYRAKLKKIKPTQERNIKPKKRTTVAVPTSHPVKPPKENRVDGVRGMTKFEYDKNKFFSPNATMNEIKGNVKDNIKKVYDYFTKK